MFVIACLAIPVFSLRAALLGRPDLRSRPVALAPDPGAQPVIGPCTSAAEAEGVQAGMRLSEALPLCPALVVVEQDRAAVEEAWERVLRRLEDAGLAVEPVHPGCAVFDTAGLERLAGGLQATLRRALDAVEPEWEARGGAGTRRVTALAAARGAPPHPIPALGGPGRGRRPASRRHIGSSSWTTTRARSSSSRSRSIFSP